MIAATRVLILALMVLSVLPAGAQSLQKGLMGCYSFSGDATDGSGNHRDGIVTGATLTTDRFGNPNSAYQFGQNKYIVIRSNSVPTVNWSYSVWIDIATIPTVPFGQAFDRFIVQTNDCNSELILETANAPLFPNDSLFFLAFANCATVQYAIQGNPINQWIHLVATGRAGVSNLFVNGVKFVATPDNNPDQQQIYQALTTYIGVNSVFNTGNFDGVIDDLAIYDRVITTGEVDQLYHDGSPCGPGIDVTVTYGCGTDSTTLTASPGPIYRWYDAFTGGNLLLEGNPLRVKVPNGFARNYYVTRVINGQEFFRVNVPVSSYSFPEPELVCSGPDEGVTNIPVTISIQATLGKSPYVYQYDLNGVTQNIASASKFAFQGDLPGKYTVKVTVIDSNQCTATCSHEVDLVETFVPNVISANRDSINETFTVFKKLGDDYVPYEGSIEFAMRIINRFGKEVYTTNDPVHGWNGSNVDPGVYYYYITFGSERLKGWVNVVN